MTTSCVSQRLVVLKDQRDVPSLFRGDQTLLAKDELDHSRLANLARRVFDYGLDLLCPGDAECRCWLVSSGIAFVNILMDLALLRVGAFALGHGHGACAIRSFIRCQVAWGKKERTNVAKLQNFKRVLRFSSDRAVRTTSSNRRKEWSKAFRIDLPGRRGLFLPVADSWTLFWTTLRQRQGLGSGDGDVHSGGVVWCGLEWGGGDQ